MNHIRDKLPDIKAKLNSLIGQTQQELTSYGDPTFTGKAHRVRLAEECAFHLIQKLVLEECGSLLFFPFERNRVR